MRYSVAAAFAACTVFVGCEQAATPQETRHPLKPRRKPRRWRRWPPRSSTIGPTTRRLATAMGR